MDIKNMRAFSKFTFKAGVLMCAAALMLTLKYEAAHPTDKWEVETSVLNGVGGLGSNKATAVSWLQSQGYELDESSYQNNGNVVVTVRDTVPGLETTDIHFHLMFDTAKAVSDPKNAKLLGYYTIENTHI